ncbi:Uu.00g090760.m01.CDS01 [Anthostomella pinea]|uniref:Uu.00g090760.m01.CDS01 n=1 Tax=Anthostomella pinea TaxID=933095 RepID=A0AAI8YKA6_9PEZI|nr:Uu.00g090760.m01.CDS01 [Anthostomella pinea]
MRHTRCLYSPARALRRVFLPDLSSGSNGLLSSTSLTKPIPRLPYLKPTAGIPSATTPLRTLATTPALRRIERKKHLTNDEIPYRWIRIASAPSPDSPSSGNSDLSPPQRTESVLSTLNRKTHMLIMVAPPPPPPLSDPSDPDSPPLISGPSAAICRIIDKVAAAAEASAAAKTARRKAVNKKELELNWAIAPNDLEHKLRRLREFLDKGMHVELMLARKRRGRPATAAESAEVLRRIREAVEEVPGAKEVRKMDGTVGGVVRMFFEGLALGSKEKKKAVEEAARAEEAAWAREEAARAKEVEEAARAKEVGEEDNGGVVEVAEEEEEISQAGEKGEEAEEGSVVREADEKGER